MFSSKIQYLFLLALHNSTIKIHQNRIFNKHIHTQTYELGTNDRVSRFKNNVSLTSTFILYSRLV